MSATALPQPLQSRAGWPWTDAVDPSVYYGLPRLPKVSVLVPSFNQGQYLEECLRSILAQSYPNLEVLVADGGSTDGSREVMAHYRDRLTWAVSEQDSGTWDADNKALSQASGEYVLVVNSDDFLLPKGLYHLLKAALEQPGLAWATGKVRAVNANSETKAVFTPKPPAGASVGRTFLKECWIYHPSTLVRRELLQRFAETDLMDWELWIRLEREGYFPAITPCVVAGLRFHADAKSFDSAHIYAGQLRLLRMLAPLYQDKLRKEKATASRRMAEAGMVALAEKGARRAAMLKWAGYGLRHLTLLVNRPYVGLGRRLISGKLDDLYKPMAFLEQPSQPIPEDVSCE